MTGGSLLTRNRRRERLLCDQPRQPIVEENRTSNYSITCSVAVQARQVRVRGRSRTKVATMLDICNEERMVNFTNMQFISKITDHSQRKMATN